MIEALQILKTEIEKTMDERIESKIKSAVEQAIKEIGNDDFSERTLTISQAQVIFGISRKTVVDIINLCGVTTEKNKCSLPGASESLTFRYGDFVVARRNAEKMGVKIRASHRKGRNKKNF